MIYAPSPSEGHLQQGEVISDLVEHIFDFRGDPAFIPRSHPFAIVISHACDIEREHAALQERLNQDAPRTLSAGEILAFSKVVFCEAELASDLRQTPKLNSDVWRRIKKNDDKRYHFFGQVRREQDAAGIGMEELAVDFRRLFAIPLPDLYHQLTQNAKRRCCLRSPFLEHFSSRLFQYHGRVGLPGNHFSEANN